MPRTRSEPHHTHSCKGRRQAQQDTQGYVANCARILPTFDQADRLHAECGERGEAPTESDNQERPQMVVGLNVHELANENADEKASGDVYKQSAERKSVRGEMLHPAAYQISENGAGG